jgi:hypothetical protein
VRRLSLVPVTRICILPFAVPDPESKFQRKAGAVAAVLYPALRVRPLFLWHHLLLEAPAPYVARRGNLRRRHRAHHIFPNLPLTPSEIASTGSGPCAPAVLSTSPPWRAATPQPQIRANREELFGSFLHFIFRVSFLHFIRPPELFGNTFLIFCLVLSDWRNGKDWWKGRRGPGALPRWEGGFRAAGRVAASESSDQGGGVQFRGMCGGLRVLPRREAGSRAAGCVATPEPSRTGRLGPVLRDTRRCVVARPTSRRSLELVWRVPGLQGTDR